MERDLLDEAVSACLDGRDGSLEAFFRELLKSQLVVPRRRQQLPLSDQPEYPSELLDVLAVRDGSRVVIPVFSRSELVKTWSGVDFVVRSLKIQDLLAIVPENWWVCLNPGSGQEKDLSPWELLQLKAGEDGIEALVGENVVQATPTASFIDVEKGAYPTLENALKEFGSSRREVQSLFLVQQELQDNSEQLPALVIGVRLTGADPKVADRIRAELKSTAEAVVIGTATVQVVQGGAIGQSMLDSVFAQFAPLYTRKSSLRSLARKIFG